MFESLDTSADNQLSLQELDVIEGEGILLGWNLQQGESLSRREFYNVLYNHIDDDADAPSTPLTGKTRQMMAGLACSRALANPDSS